MIISSIPSMKAGVMTSSLHRSLMLSIASATAWVGEANNPSCSLVLGTRLYTLTATLRTGKISRNTRILEAIADKVAREMV